MSLTPLLAAALASALVGCRHERAAAGGRPKGAEAVDSSTTAQPAQLRVKVCPVGDVAANSVQVAAEALREVLGADARIGATLPLPAKAYDEARRQYRSDTVLAAIAREATKTTDADTLLGIADVDMYTPGLNFVLGQAQLGGRAALMTTARLDPRFFGARANPKLLRARIEKEAVHELGHAIGLRHCPQRRCVMHFSNTLADTDYKRREPCAPCSQRLRQLLKRRSA